MLRKPKLYNKAIALRREGFSYGEILKFVKVGSGTISRWCSEISLTEEQKERLRKKKINSPLIKRLRRQAIQSKKIARKWAKDKLSGIKGDSKTLFIVGSILYWAEGTKSGGGGGIEFTNTDPKMIKVIMKFLRKIMGVSDDKFKIIVRISDKGNVKKAERYWSRIAKVSIKNFRKPELLRLNEKSRSLEKYPYGMCRITVYDSLLRRKMLNIVKEFSKISYLPS